MHFMYLQSSAVLNTLHHYQVTKPVILLCFLHIHKYFDSHPKSNNSLEVRKGKEFFKEKNVKNVDLMWS